MKNLLLGISLFIGMSFSAFLFNGCNGNNTSSATSDTTANNKMSGVVTNHQNDMKEDSQRVNDLLTMNYNEVNILQLALTKQMPTTLKTSVQQMLSDHKKAVTELKDLASKKNIVVPNAGDDSGAKKYNDLSKENGTTFEKDFLSWVISTHQDAISKCQDITKNSHDTDIVAWCNSALPTLQNHLQMAQTAQSNLK